LNPFKKLLFDDLIDILTEFPCEDSLVNAFSHILTTCWSELVAFITFFITTCWKENNSTLKIAIFFIYQFFSLKSFLPKATATPNHHHHHLFLPLLLDQVVFF
jgi:hypothetical protein